MLFSNMLTQVLGFVQLLYFLASHYNLDVFVILSQENRYHDKLAQIKKLDITQQCDHLGIETKILLMHKDFNGIPGSWTILPVFERLISISNHSWVFFLEEVTQVNVTRLLFVLSTYDASKDYFLGYALKDSQPTIIHHFDSSDGSAAISYPDFSAGFAISLTLVKKLTFKWESEKKLDFSIDAQYELAKFIATCQVNAIKLTHEPHFCLVDQTVDCATWIDKEASKCRTPVAKESIYFAVKTYEKFHNDRVQVVLNTWAKEAGSIHFFSNREESSVPTINLGIPNVPNGHCEKTISILKYALKDQFNADWLVVADDDTLISVMKLRQLLACYDPTEFVALGERYGYGVATPHGYDYITGGAGMIFTKPTVEAVISTCECPSNDSPDDMIIGLCLKRLGIPITHSSNFHQARPEDYSMDLLSHQSPVSFHKHWMVDPYHVYKTWLNDSEPHAFYIHSEL